MDSFLIINIYFQRSRNLLLFLGLNSTKSLHQSSLSNLKISFHQNPRYTNGNTIVLTWLLPAFYSYLKKLVVFYVTTYAPLSNCYLILWLRNCFIHWNRWIHLWKSFRVLHVGGAFGTRMKMKRLCKVLKKCIKTWWIGLPSTLFHTRKCRSFSRLCRRLPGWTMWFFLHISKPSIVIREHWIFGILQNFQQLVSNIVKYE